MSNLPDWLPDVTLTPDELKERNVTWRQEAEQKHPRFNFKRSKEGQKPQVLWIGCVDTRVPESLVTGASPGDILVHRNIANQVHVNDPNTVSVIDFAIRALGVRHIAVVGHTACGGVFVAGEDLIKPPDAKSDAEEKEVFEEAKADAGPRITRVTAWVEPLREHPKSQEEYPLPTDILTATKLNIRRQVENLKQIHSVQEALQGDTPLQLHGWLYHLSNGELEVL